MRVLECHLVPLESVQESDADHGRPDARHVSESSEDQRLHLHVLHPGLGHSLDQTQPVQGLSRYDDHLQIVHFVFLIVLADRPIQPTLMGKYLRIFENM